MLFFEQKFDTTFASARLNIIAYASIGVDDTEAETADQKLANKV